VRIGITAVAARKAGGSTLILENVVRRLPGLASHPTFRIYTSLPLVRRLAQIFDIEADEGTGGSSNPVEHLVGVTRTKERTDPIKHQNVELVPVELGSGLDRLVWDQVVYPKELRKWRADISVNALGFGPAVLGVPQVTFLQDSTYFCDWRGFQRTFPERLRIAALRQLLLAVIKRSSRVVVPSEALRDAVDLATKSKLSDRLIVLRDAFEMSDVESALQDSPNQESTKNESRRRPFRILYLSHLESHKAHSMLPSVARHLRDRLSAVPVPTDTSGISSPFSSPDGKGPEQRGGPGAFEIVVAVDREDNPRLYDAFVCEIERQEVANCFEIHPRLPRAKVTELLADADAFLFPSLCESFGYPLVEAGSVGLPVVAADTPINREMLGPDALYFPPLRAEIAAERLARLILDPSLRDSCAESIGRHQRRILIGWDEYTRRLVEILEEAKAVG
jgi:glycosyltransferase involved in cell wall biosynthesis